MQIASQLSNFFPQRSETNSLSLSLDRFDSAGGSDVEVDTKSSDRSGYVTFGMSSAEVIESDLADNDPTNDSLALVMREAGGIGPYVDLPDEERQRLHTKYATSPESRSQPLAGLASDLTACVPYLAPTYRNGEFRLSGQPHKYRVDSLGRPEWALAYFREGPVTTALRDGCTTTVGSWGTSPPGTPEPVGGYVGGHLIAAGLGGSPARLNLTPQAQEINASTFPRIESAVKACGSKSQWMVDYKITPRYGASPLTPNSYRVWIRVLPNEWSWGWVSGGGEGAIEIANWTSAQPSHLNNVANINRQVDAYTAAVRAVCP